MKYDTRGNRQRNSVIIFRNIITFVTEIQVQSLISYVVHTGWPPY